MSILVVQALYEGLIFAADRNVTSTSIQETRDGRTIYVNQGQTQRPKVLRWPNNKALIGYVGVAEIGGTPTDQWLYDFIGRYINFNNFEELGNILKDEVESQRKIDEAEEEPKALFIHLAGFEDRDGIQVPVIWFITNSHRFDPAEGYTDIAKDFLVSEELWKEKVRPITPQNVRDYLRKKASDFDPVWFHQGADLHVFNAVDFILRQRLFRLLIEKHPKHRFPQTLDEWGQYLSMIILTYEAYFQSFYGPSEQYVGGGVDIVALTWPE